MNLLLIGRENSWIVNARTSHKQHFVGTRQLVGLTGEARNVDSWRKLKTLALRFASSGATLKVFCLHPADGVSKLVSETTKSAFMLYQPPGCNKEATNGIKLPPRIQIPIESTRLDPDGLSYWSEVQNDIARVLSSKVRTIVHEKQDQEMKSEEI